MTNGMNCELFVNVLKPKTNMEHYMSHPNVKISLRKNEKDSPKNWDDSSWNQSTLSKSKNKQHMEK